MPKNVYLLMTDLHFDFNKANRLNYFGEVMSAMQDISNINDKYKVEGYTTHLIFLGDVCDGSLSNASEAMQAIEILRYFCGRFDKVHAVVGNHELTYARDNPFWFLVSEVQDIELASARRFLQPRGLTNTISVPSVLTDGEVNFFFNHFGTTPKVPQQAGKHIGLFHQNVGSNDICKMWGTFDNVEEAAYVQGYHYCFFGHMHLAKGRYYLDESHTCVGEWLGTIGRTKVDEIQLESLDVNIPAVIVVDGKFVAVEDNTITLPPPVECIDYAKLRASQQSRKMVLERQQAVQSTFVGNSLFETLEIAFANTPHSFLLDFLDRPIDDVLYSYRQTLLHPGEDSEEDA